MVVFLKHIESTNSSKRLNTPVPSKCIARIGPFEASAHVCPGCCTSARVCRRFVPPQMGRCSQSQMAKLDHLTFTHQASSRRFCPKRLSISMLWAGRKSCYVGSRWSLNKWVFCLLRKWFRSPDIGWDETCLVRPHSMCNYGTLSLVSGASSARQPLCYLGNVPEIRFMSF